MSASPAGGPNGQNPSPAPSKGPHPRIIRKRPADNPLVPRRKPLQRPPGHQPPPGAPSLLKGAAPGPLSKSGIGKAPQNGNSFAQSVPNFEELRKRNDGWTDAKPQGANDFPLVTTKKALKEAMRSHVMRLVPPHNRGQTVSQQVDPTNQEQFPRPVTLHRRDPRQPPPGREVKEELPERTPAEQEEADKLAQLKAERDAQRAIDDAQKAPVAKDSVKRVQPKKQDKRPATQIVRQPRTEAQKKEAEIRYEEALPWHLEDADGKNVYVGQYEAPLSYTRVAFKIGDNGFHLIPLEKYYKFTSKRAGMTALTIEEAEKQMGKKMPMSRWAMRDAKREQNERAMADSRTIMNGRTAVKQESSTFQAASRSEKMDHDDIDMSGDEFQDDDETPGFEQEKDEDEKDSKERVRREQLGANLFGDANEQEVEKEEADAKKEELQKKMFGKDLKKALLKRDKQYQYDSDSSDDSDPFRSSSESDSDSEDNKDESKADKDKVGASGTSSKGTNTPQGKKAAAEAAKKGKSLKRPGSPLVSDSSGTESTRKKKKLGPSMGGSRSTTPLPGNLRKRTGAGSTSDGEMTAGEMSDGAGGRKKRPGAPGTGAKGTPVGSRAGSPVPGQAMSPNSGSPSSPRPSQPFTAPTVQEIIDAIPPPPDGISIGTLLKKFQGRVGDEAGAPMTRKEWLKLVRENSSFSQTEKLLRRKI